MSSKQVIAALVVSLFIVSSFAVVLSNDSVASDNDAEITNKGTIIKIENMNDTQREQFISTETFSSICKNAVWDLFSGIEYDVLFSGDSTITCTSVSVEYSLSNYSVTGKSIQSMIAYTVKVTGMTLTVTLDSDERLLSDWMHVDDYTKFLVEQFGDVIIRSGEKITFTGDFLYQSTYFPDMYSEEDVKYGFSYVDTDKYVVDKNINEHYTKVTGNLNVKLPKDVNKIELVSEYEYKGAYNTVNEFYNGVKNVKEGSPYIERETDDWYSYTNNLTLKYNGKSCIENYYYRHNYSIDTYLNYVYSYMIKTEEETVASDVSFPSHFFNYSDFAALQAAITSAGLTGGVDTTHPDIAKKNCEELLNRVHTESDNEINVGITIAVVAVLIIVAIGAIWYFNYRE